MTSKDILYLSAMGDASPAFLLAWPEVRVLPLRELASLTPAQWANVGAMMVPAHADQRFLLTQRSRLEAWLLDGGTLVFNGHVAYPFLHGLQAFQPQSVPGLAGLRVHRGPAHPVFEGVDAEHLTFRRGVAGFYARGCNPPPDGALVLNTLGDNHLPIDWLQALPGGGRLLVHAGNDMWMHAQGEDSAARIAPQLMAWLLSDRDRADQSQPMPDLTAYLSVPAWPEASAPAPQRQGESSVVAALDAGTYYHHRSLHTPEWQGCIDYSVYVHDLNDQALQACDIFIVSCTSPIEPLVARKGVFERFLAQGKTLVVMGANHPAQWLDGVQWVESPVNFWWWLTPGADSGLRIAAGDHDLFHHLRLEDATWHQHGAHLVPPGAVSLIDKQGVGSVLYDDRVSTPGRLIVTSLDPMYHHGSYFMPASTRFLNAFLPWLKQQ